MTTKARAIHLKHQQQHLLCKRRKKASAFEIDFQKSYFPALTYHSLGQSPKKTFFLHLPLHGGGDGLAVAVQIVEPATLAATVHAIQNSAMTATVQTVQMQAAAVK